MELRVIRKKSGAAETAPRQAGSETKSNVRLISGAELVRKLEVFITKRVIVPQGVGLALGLWAIGTHLFEIFDCFPYVCLTSPTKRCGKTLLAELVGLISARTKNTVAISEAALFRTIHAFRPTIIIDEAEALADRRAVRSQVLVSLLNAGHRRNAVVIRCSGPGHTPREFPVFCPKIVIAIGNPPDTLRDRALVVQMRRKRKDETVAPYRYREVSAKGERRAALCSVWAEAHRQQVAAKYERESLDFLSDRENDNWAPLFAIAAVAVPERLAELRQIALDFAAAKHALDVDDSHVVRLLSDVQQIFTDHELERVSTHRLLARLQALEQGSWENLSAAKLGRMLKPFGVSSKQLWLKGQNVRGYELDDLKPVFASYLPS
jgi:putative DNA primase/helicase